MVGARLVDPYADGYKTMVLKPNKIRGIQSEGMACSEKELGLSGEHEGIILLPVNALAVCHWPTTWATPCWRWTSRPTWRVT